MDTVLLQDGIVSIQPSGPDLSVTGEAEEKSSSNESHVYHDTYLSSELKANCEQHRNTDHKQHPTAEVFGPKVALAHAYHYTHTIDQCRPLTLVSHREIQLFWYGPTGIFWVPYMERSRALAPIPCVS